MDGTARLLVSKLLPALLPLLFLAFLWLIHLHDEGVRRAVRNGSYCLLYTSMSRFRGWIQAGATLLTNLHLPNFLKGGLYQGAGKTVCVPWLNCYSCLLYTSRCV